PARRRRRGHRLALARALPADDAGARRRNELRPCRARDGAHRARAQPRRVVDADRRDARALLGRGSRRVGDRTVGAAERAPIAPDHRLGLALGAPHLRALLRARAARARRPLRAAGGRRPPVERRARQLPLPARAGPAARTHAERGRRRHVGDDPARLARRRVPDAGPRRPCDIRRPRRDLHRRRHRRRLGPRDPAGVPSRRHDAGRMNDIPLRRNRDFVLLQVGQALSTIGSQSSSIAYPLLVLATTHSPAKAGVVGFANIAPYAIFALFAGVAADRWDRKQVMIAMDTARVLAMVSIVVVYALGKLTFAQIAIVAFLEGTAFVFFNVAEVG